MYQRSRVTSHGMVLKMVKYQFYVNPKNDRDCRSWPCKSTHEPCKNIVRVWILSLVHTLCFPTRLRHSLIQMGRFRRFCFGGVSFFCSIGKDDASFYQWDHHLFMVCSGVRKRRLRDVRSDMLFAPYGHHVPSWERIQGYFSPTHWGICLSKTCIIYSLDHRSEYFFARTWKRTSWLARRYAGCHWGRHGCSWDAIWVNKCAEKKSALFNHPCGSNDFFVVEACTPVHMRVRKSKNCEF
jgi:hypothetical protein